MKKKGGIILLIDFEGGRLFGFFFFVMVISV